MSISDEGYQIALEEARASVAEGGIPVGSSIVDANGKVLGRGHNQRKQNGSPILHGETAAFDSNRTIDTADFAGTTLYTTLSPCPMCAGAAIWFKVKRIVIGENENMSGREELLRSHGIEVVVLGDKDAEELMNEYSAKSAGKTRF